MCLCFSRCKLLGEEYAPPNPHTETNAYLALAPYVSLSCSYTAKMTASLVELTLQTSVSTIQACAETGCTLCVNTVQIESLRAEYGSAIHYQVRHGIYTMSTHTRTHTRNAHTRDRNRRLAACEKCDTLTELLLPTTSQGMGFSSKEVIQT